MKKTIFAILTSAALAFSCNDGNRTSEDNDNDRIESEETLEPSTEESDTTSTWDQDRDKVGNEDMNRDDGTLDDNDQLDNDDDSGVRRDTASTRDNGQR